MSSHYSKDQKDFYKNQVRRLLIMDNSLSGWQIHRLLRDNGIRIGYKYVLSIMKKIEREKAHTQLNYTLRTYLQNFIDTLTEGERQLWKIATDPATSRNNKIFALKEIREGRKVLFDKLFEAGIFEKQLGRLQLDSLTSIVKEVTLIENATNKRTTGEDRDGQTLEIESGDFPPHMLGEGPDHLGEADGDPSRDHAPS